MQTCTPRRFDGHSSKYIDRSYLVWSKYQRNPEVIRIYNELLQNISQDLRISHLMTTDIITPLWDSAPDWCHYKNDVGLIEALFILQSISIYDSCSLT